MKKVLAIIVALVMLSVLLVSCGQDDPAPAAEGGAAAADGVYTGLRGTPDQTYYMLPFLAGVDYWFPCFAGFKQAGNNLGVRTYFVGTTDVDPNTHVELFEQILARNPSGIFVPPITPESMVDPINRAVAQGVAVATWSSHSPESDYQAWVSSDNHSEGVGAARAMAEHLGGSGKVMVTTTTLTAHINRANAFVETIENEFPNIEVVAHEMTNLDENIAYAAVLTVAQMHPDLGGVFTPEAQSGLGAANAAMELGGNIAVATVDLNEQVLDMIASGDILFALNPDQGTQGYWGMMILFHLYNDHLMEPMNDRRARGVNPLYIPLFDNSFNIVNAENVEWFHIDAYIERLGYSSLDELLSPGTGVPTHWDWRAGR